MTESPPARARVSIARRIIVGAIVVSFGVAALGGIAVLLGAELGEDALRVLGTTALVGAFSVAVLCCVSLVGRRLQLVGFAGAAISVVAALLSIFVVWYEGPWGDGFDTLIKWTWTAVAASAAFSLGCLLLLLADRRRAAVRTGLAITLVLFAVVLVLIVVAIWWNDLLDEEVYPRVLGITAILAALGAVVVPVLSLLIRDRTATPIGPDAIARLQAEAQRRGITTDELVERLLVDADAAHPAEPAPAAAAAPPAEPAPPADPEP